MILFFCSYLLAWKKAYTAATTKQKFYEADVKRAASAQLSLILSAVQRQLMFWVLLWLVDSYIIPILSSDTNSAKFPLGALLSIIWIHGGIMLAIVLISHLLGIIFTRLLLQNMKAQQQDSQQQQQQQQQQQGNLRTATEIILFYQLVLMFVLYPLLSWWATKKTTLVSFDFPYPTTSAPAPG